MKPTALVLLFLALVLPLGAASIAAGTPEGEAEIDKLAAFARDMEQQLDLVQSGDQINETPLAMAIRQCREREYSKGLPVIEKLASERDPRAAYVLAKMHALGVGMPKSEDKARSLFALAAKLGHPPALVELAILAEGAGSDEALVLYRQAAKAGDPMADLKLGHCYETGALGLTEDPKLAFAHYKMAADAGFPLAMFHLGRCHDNGIGVAPDAGKGTRLIRDAALRGHVAAQLAMAGRYYQGKGLESDPVAAVGWLTVASQNGSAEAMLLLADRYERGDAVLQDFEAAGRLYASAAKEGDMRGRVRLASLYLDGKGTARDPVRAYVLLAQCGDFAPARELLTRAEAALTPEQLASAKTKLAAAPQPDPPE